MQNDNSKQEQPMNNNTPNSEKQPLTHCPKCNWPYESADHHQDCIDHAITAPQPEAATREGEEIIRLRKILSELWPLATNAFGELSTEEIADDPILIRLSCVIDEAKQALSLPTPPNQ